MPYVPNAADSTQPTEDKTVESAALEFRTLKVDVIRSLKFPSGEILSHQGPLPSASNRAGRFLAFDSVTGVPISGPLIDDWTITQAQIANISTVAGALTPINTVATNVANVNAVAGSITAINTIYANLAEILNADTQAAAAAASATSAAAAQAAAASSATAAAASASTATTQAGIATTQAVNAAGSATSSATSATASANSASTASGAASAAASSASTANSASTTATSAATSAASSATASANSATSAANSAATATTQAGIATTKAAEAATAAAGVSFYVTAAANSATDAANSASTAVAAQVAAAASASGASTSASNAAGSAATATTQANSATASAAAASAVALGNEPVRHSVRPSLLLDFANSKVLDPRINFTRASTATYYDGKTTAKAEENFALLSEQFDNTFAWTVSDASITPDNPVYVAPDGTYSADALSPSFINASHWVGQPVFASLNTQYAASVYVLATSVGTLYVTLTLTNSSTSNRYATIVVDPNTGTITQSSASATSTIHSSSVTSVGGGWYRVSMVASQSSTGFNAFRVGLSDTATPALTTFGHASFLPAMPFVFVPLIWGAQYEQRSFTGSYTRTLYDKISTYIPQLLTAAAGVPRFDHNPMTRESRGLLIEEQRTNLLTYSEQLDNAAWFKNTVTITPNAAIAPDGNLTADKVVMSVAASDDFYLYQVYPGWTSGVTYTQTWYVKSAGAPWVQVTGSTGTAATVFRNINLTTGALGSGTAVPIVTDVGNGWFRISISEVANSTSASGRFLLVFLTSDVSTRLGNVAGDGYMGAYVWGAQLEAGAFPTSYIPTVASQVTRSADVANITGTNFSSWYRQDEGTVYAEAAINYANSDNKRIMQMSDGTSSNRLDMYFGSNGSSVVVFGVSSGTTEISGPTVASGITQTNFNKAAFGYATNNFAATGNGGAPVTDTSYTVPTFNTLRIGYSTVSGVINGAIKKIAYYPKRLADAELQGVTTV